VLTKIITAYNEAVFDTDRDQALEIIHQAVAEGITPEDIVFKVVIPAMELMIKSISEDFDANLAQHFMASQIASQVTDEMVAKFQTSPHVVGTVILGTSHGDMHTLGKRIVSGCLRSLMIEVVDLGVNIPAEQFVEAALTHNASVIAISSMMMHTARSELGCLKVREILKNKNLEDKIKIVVGGAPYRWDPHLYQAVQADAWAEDGITAGKVIKELIMEMQK
jgi:methanogenic corrinoid protein MtbC1